MKFYLLAVFYTLFFTLVGAENIFSHSVKSDKKPWNHENFAGSDGDFTFIILPDRTGEPRKGVFKDAVEKANMFNPDFIISVGDIIQGQMYRQHQEHDFLRNMWKDVRQFIDKSEVPFFYVVGNHDLARTREGFPRSYETSYDVWKENFGPETYYSFVYKNVLFICLNQQEGRNAVRLAAKNQISITPEQVQWVRDTLKKNSGVRWTFVFVHSPGGWSDEPFVEIEKALQDRNYTVFSGDWHRYIKFKRHGRNYYALGTAGGISRLRGVEYGEFDHLTYVKMSAKGPRVVNVKLDGVVAEDAVTYYNIKDFNREKKKDKNIPVEK